MIRYSSIWLVALVSFAGSPVWAEPAYTLKPVNVRAGPARDYPLVAQLPPGAPVEVGGCLSGYSWCDVYSGPLRGWVYAGNLAYPYQDQRVPILGYGAVIGLPIIAFSLGSYWDHYYRGRPWFGQRSQYVNRPRHGFRPAPVPSRPGFQRPPSRPGFRPPGPAHGGPGNTRPPGGGGRPGGGARPGGHR